MIKDKGLKRGLRVLLIRKDFKQLHMLWKTCIQFESLVNTEGF